MPSAIRLINSDGVEVLTDMQTFAPRYSRALLTTTTFQTEKLSKLQFSLGMLLRM